MVLVAALCHALISLCAWLVTCLVLYWLPLPMVLLMPLLMQLLMLQ